MSKIAIITEIYCVFCTELMHFQGFLWCEWCT